MGFVAGFTGGVTLTLSLTYLALLTHNQNRTAQSALLRSQASTLDCLLPPDRSGGPRRRNTSAVLPDGTYRPRESLTEYDDTVNNNRPVSSFFETAKARWNAEVLGAARWVQEKDWGKVRERGEDEVARLLGVTLSKEPVVVEEEVPVPEYVPVREVRPVSVTVSAEKVGEVLRGVGERTVEVAQAVQKEGREVVVQGVEGLEEGVSRGVEVAKAKGAEGAKEAKGMIAKGMEKAHDMVGRAKAAVYLAEEKAEASVDAKLLHLSEIERALQERYDSALREERLKRSAEEVLRERYLPIDKRDNSRLRGL